MRCLALAQAWQDAGGRVVFVTSADARPLEAKLKSGGAQVVLLDPPRTTEDDARQTVGLAREHGASWVVADGYDFGSDYQRVVRGSGLRLLVVDDYGHAERYYADVVLNQNAYADASMYVGREPYTRLLLGTGYALLRREFWGWRGWRRAIPERARNILVTMGGADPHNVSLTVVRALQRVMSPEMAARVLVGPVNPHFESLSRAVRGDNIRLLRHADDMPSLMAWADVAVSAAGSTCWELAFMGLPGALVVLADNQRKIAESVHAAGAAVSLGRHEEAGEGRVAAALTGLFESPAGRRQMSRRGRALVDGLGGARVAAALCSTAVKLTKAVG